MKTEKVGLMQYYWPHDGGQNQGVIGPEERVQWECIGIKEEHFLYPQELLSLDRTDAIALRGQETNWAKLTLRS